MSARGAQDRGGGIDARLDVPEPRLRWTPPILRYAERPTVPIRPREPLGDRALQDAGMGPPQRRIGERRDRTAERLPAPACRPPADEAVARSRR